LLFLCPLSLGVSDGLLANREILLRGVELLDDDFAALLQVLGCFIWCHAKIAKDVVDKRRGEIAFAVVPRMEIDLCGLAVILRLRAFMVAEFCEVRNAPARTMDPLRLSSNPGHKRADGPSFRAYSSMSETMLCATWCGQEFPRKSHAHSEAYDPFVI
jgi:hypothetical protein